MKTDPKTLFTNTERVWMSENFQNIIFDRFTGTDLVHAEDVVTPKYVDLSKVSEVTIEQCIFTNIDAFLHMLADLIQNQIHGEEGVLLHDSSANYFYLQLEDAKFYSVLVRFEPAQKLWRCGAYLQDTLQKPNIRIFLPV